MSIAERSGAWLSSPARVVAAIVTLVLAAFSATGFLAVRTLESQLTERLDSQLSDEALTTRAIVESLSTTELNRLGGARRPSGTTALVVLDSSGKPVYVEPVERPGNRRLAPSAEGLNVRGGGDPFTVDGHSSVDFRAVAVPTSTGFTIVVAAPLDELHDTVRELAGRIALLSGIAFVILAGLVWLVINNANRQVDKLVDRATRIGHGDLTSRAESGGSGTAGRLSEALDDMTEQLEVAFAAREESEARLRQFAADASHELRTPLTHVRGYAELLSSGRAVTDEERSRAVERIESEARRMAGLVEDLLMLARLDQHPQVRAEAIDLGSLLTECVTDARTVDGDRPLTLTVPPDEVTVHGDEARLRQVFVNLLANVRVHTPTGTTAQVSLSRLDGDAVVVVHDDGPGMSPEAAAQAFDRFYRSERSRSRSSGGSGLGLSIVRSIVEAHGGTATLTSELGAGTTTTITLPASTDSNGADPK